MAFRGNNASADDVIRAAEPVHRLLEDLSAKHALDKKIAEYVFFPLSHIFNETQRLPARCLEIAIKSLKILVLDGYGNQLPPAMGKQLIILLTLIVGGSPSKIESEPLRPQVVEELSIAGFNCLGAIFEVLEGPTAETTIYHDIGTATIVDQTVYILLEGLVDEQSDDVCLAAAKALQSFYIRISDREVLASIMPRTISALVKVIKPSTQVRRSYKLLEICLHIMTHFLRAVISDRVIAETKKTDTSLPQTQRPALDGSWLKASTTQIKLALANVIQIRRHQRYEVQAALLELCAMVIEDCQTTLHDALPLIIETVVVLADKEEETSNDAYKTLMHLTTTYSAILDALKESLHSWLTSFPRIMQNNDETAKQWAIRQISTAFQALSQVQSGSNILSNNLAFGLCDSVGAVVRLSTSGPQPLATTAVTGLNLDVISSNSKTLEFLPVILEHKSQERTLLDLKSMIVKLNNSDSGNEITRLIVNQVHARSDESTVGPFWLALTALRSQSTSAAIFDDFLVDDQPEQSMSPANRRAMIDELYYNSLIILTDLPADGSGDWRTMALAIEAVALQAQQLGEAFRPELMEALYPILQLLASNNSNLQRHAMTCLNILTKACNYQDTSTMIIENVDYLVNSVSLKLNTFDVSPYPPQVLFMMVKLCGARLIPYLDDVVDSIFGIVDLYHGYPKLVEMLFRTLAAIVEEGSRKPSLLTIDDGREKGPHDQRKSRHQQLSISDLAADITKRKFQRAKNTEDDIDLDERIPHPQKPWSETYDKPPPEPQTIEELLNQAESDEPLPPPKEPEDSEKPLSKTHSLLLHIIKSIPTHLSSPSPYLRRSLLGILINILPTLSQNENSFLPLINDLWPAVASRIVFPTSLGDDSASSTNLMTRTTPTSTNKPPIQPDTHTFQEETFVITTACQAIEAMCKGAGDFMASRVDPEFARWDRLYTRVWTKVRQDAEAANERRMRQQRQDKARSKAQVSLIQAVEPASNASAGLMLTSSLALSSTTAGSGPRAFTPHHALWRALISLFLTILTRVRLPLEIGDRICQILGEWITLFVGPDYYFSVRGARGVDDAQKSMLAEVDGAIQAMETWNADLAWFIFMQQRHLWNGEEHVPEGKTGCSGQTLEVGGEVLRFAELAF